MKLLIVEDEPAFLEVLSGFLRDQGHRVETAATAGEGFRKAQDFGPDLVLLDLFLPDESGLELLPRLKRERPGALVILMTGAADVKSAVEAMRLGAENYLEKPLRLDELQLVIRRCGEKIGLQREVEILKRLQRDQYRRDYLFLSHPAMERVYDQIQHMADKGRRAVLILGETGTGKEHAARLLHLLSAHSSGPFLSVHCGATPGDQLEGILFGPWTSDRPGLLETAEGGTLFLDEVGDMPLSVQARLLQVLENGTYRPMEGEEEIVSETRIVAATHRNLETEVREGRFRQDLYFRLNGLSLHLPPLRDRPDDILDLARFFLREAERTLGRETAGFNPEVLDRFRLYPWPGNVRELKSAVDRLLLLAKGTWLELEDLPQEILHYESPLDGGTPEEGRSNDEVERENILAMLRYTKWNKSIAAERLKISRKTLLRKISRYQLHE